MNNRGQIAGVVRVASGAQHGFLWDDGIVTDQGTPGVFFSTAVAINNRTQVVGNADLPDSRYHAVLWENGAVIDLGTLPGDVSSFARDINDRGQIVGESISAEGFRPPLSGKTGP